MSNFTPEAQAQLQVIAQSIADNVRLYMSQPENRAKYEAWYQERYGKPCGKEN